MKLLLFGIAVLLVVPFVTFAHPEDANIVPHDEIDEVVEVQVIQTQEGIDEEVEVSQIVNKVVEDDDDFVGDKHTDHAHEPVVSGPWWQNKTWWTYLIVSLLLMSILSFGVFKYLEDDK